MRLYKKLDPASYVSFDPDTGVYEVVSADQVPYLVPVAEAQRVRMSQAETPAPPAPKLKPGTYRRL